METNPIYPYSLGVTVDGSQGLCLNIKLLDDNIEKPSDPDFKREVYNKSKPLIQ